MCIIPFCSTRNIYVRSKCIKKLKLKLIYIQLSFIKKNKKSFSFMLLYWLYCMYWNYYFSTRDSLLFETDSLLVTGNRLSSSASFFPSVHTSGPLLKQGPYLNHCPHNWYLLINLLRPFWNQTKNNKVSQELLQLKRYCLAFIKNKNVYKL